MKKFNFFFLFIFIFVGLNEVLNKRVFKIKGGNVDEMFLFIWYFIDYCGNVFKFFF